MAVQTQMARRRYVLVLIVLSALTLATLDKRSGDSGPIGAVGRLAHRIVQPFANAADTVFSPVHDWWDSVIHSGRYKSENRDLRHEIAQLRAKLNESDQAVLLLHYYESYFGKRFLDAFDEVGASVVTGDPGNFDRTITIDRGTEAKIAPNMAVVAPEGLVGRVLRASRGGAQVLLVTDTSFHAAVHINGRFGITNTQDDGTLRVEFSVDTRAAPRTRINVGDVATTCGPCHQSDFPDGIPVGTVVRVTQDGPTQVVTLEPFIDVGSLDLVKVVLWLAGDKVPVQPVPAPTTTVAPTTTAPTSTTVPGASTSSSNPSGP